MLYLFILCSLRKIVNLRPIVICTIYLQYFNELDQNTFNQENNLAILEGRYKIPYSLIWFYTCIY